MDIQNVFKKQATLYLNSSLVVLFVAVFCFLANLFYFSNVNLILIVLPFIVYSIYLFHMYVMFHKRALVTVNTTFEAVEDLFSQDQFLLYFIPEERELLYFHPTGTLMGKMIEQKKNKNRDSRQLPSEYLLVDINNQVLATYYKSNDSVDVYEKARGYFGTFSYNEDKDFKMLSNEATGYLKKEAAVSDDYIKNQNNQVVFRIRKGWMPLKYQQIFHNPNLPVLTLHRELTKEEKLLYLSCLVNRFF
jgi:hypothetical protein